ncbi:MAG TPA: DUF116 domain-containing protein [Thermoplasmata archaeon]
MIDSSSESRKPDKGDCAARHRAKADPAKLVMVSDFLKRTLSDRPYAFILESLADRLELRKVSPRLNSVGIIPVPVEFDPKRFADERSVGFAPYCSKPFDCPLNATLGRKSNSCQAVDDKCEHHSCSINRFIKIAHKLGIQEFYVIETDSGLFRWLAKKREEGYKHVVGVACEFAVSYALEVIHGQLGFDGYIVVINGDKCKTKVDYSESDISDRGRLTFVDEWTLAALEEIADHLASETNGVRENGVTTANSNRS